MNNKLLFLIVIACAVILIVSIYLHSQQINESVAGPRTVNFQVNHFYFDHHTVQIEKVDGNGNSFGDNNKIENKVA